MTYVDHLLPVSGVPASAREVLGPLQRRIERQERFELDRFPAISGGSSTLELLSNGDEIGATLVVELEELGLGWVTLVAAVKLLATIRQLLDPMVRHSSLLRVCLEKPVEIPADEVVLRQG